jgi:UDP:flavonoid glycosyltransferase YjiC (YdhE family)
VGGVVSVSAAAAVALRPIVLGSLERIVGPHVNEVRELVGLPRIRDARELFGTPPLLLYLTAEPFEYPRSNWPDNVRLVGACDWDPPAEPPPWLDAIDRPIVLVTTSSEFQDDGRLVRCALEALAGEPLHVIATLPSGDPKSFDAPANATVRSFRPHGAVLERAACAITHGGMGATQKALARAAFRSAPCRSDATSSRSPAASRWRPRARGFPPSD